MAKEQNGIFEAQLFKAADKLRKNIDAAEYKNVALGLIFLKYISESFQELYDKLAQDEFSDPEDRDEYKAENIFFVPEQARWKNLQAKAKLPTIGQELDDAMESIEKENPELRNVLPKVFGKPNLDKTSLGQLIDLISNTELKATSENSKDLFGRVYEYFLGEFANAEGKKGGQFYTPKSIVKLMVEMIEPYKGRVYDPACGSGGMFVMSEKFVSEHQGNIKDITIYGQESNQTTWKLSKMNLAIRNINSQFVAWNTEGSFLKDAHPDLKADYILANPPFNQSDWGQEILQDDARWKYGVPPAGNANFAWMQHMLYHLATNGVMATVLANGSLSSNTSGEGEIRKNLIENDLVECIVALPDKLFYNTGISACIWFLRREKQTRKGEVLFIDASKLGYMINNTNRIISESELEIICKTYLSWKNEQKYENIKAFCYSASISEINELGNNLTPKLYTGSNEDENKIINHSDFDLFLNEFLLESSKQSKELNEEISNQLKDVFPDFKWNGIDFTSKEILEEIGNKIFNKFFSEIFEGTTNGKLGDLVNIDSGFPFKSNDFETSGKYRIVTISNVQDGEFISKTKDGINEIPIKMPKWCSLKTGDILMSLTGNVGRVCHVIGENYLLNQRVAKMSSKINGADGFTYFLLRNKKLLSILEGISSGTAQQNLSPIKMGEIGINIPLQDLLNKYANVFNAIVKKIIFNKSQIINFYKKF